MPVLSSLNEKLPCVIVEHDGELHQLNARTIRAVRDGHYLGDAVQMSQLLAVAILEKLDDGH